MRALTPKQNGPAATPTAVLKARGSWRAKAREKTEPQIEPGIPDCPTSLKGLAEKTWYEMCRDLAAIGVLTKIDGKALARYCRAWAQWCALADIDESTLKIESVDDLRTVHTHVDRMIRLSEHLLKLEVQYGLTPASRPHVHRLETPPHGNSTAHKDKSRFFVAG